MAHDDHARAIDDPARLELLLRPEAAELCREQGVRVSVTLHPEEGSGAGETVQRMLDSLHRAQDELADLQRLATLGEIGAGVTHEVRNAMTGVVGFAQMAQTKLQNPASLEELLRLIERESRRCLSILSHFLDYARPQDHERQKVRPAEVVNAVAVLVRHQLAMHRVTLSVTVADDIPQVRADQGELEQVILNLVTNAMDAMPQGGGVYLDATRSPEGGALIRVSDSGPGVPAELRDRIFDPFFSTKPRGAGTGLGLHVSRGIVRDHGGTLELGSEPGRGAVFVIRLPAAEEQRG